MTTAQENNKRIAKNTMMLYFRMILTMLVSLYTSRVVLNVLGVDDYGVYSLVGGIVASFGFLSATISSANSRFLSYAIGKNDNNYLSKIFTLANTSNIIIALVIFIACEVAGTWWISNKMVIPDGKLYMAHVIFQISLLAAIISLITSAFLALIISYERMGLFAITQLVQVLLKLGVVIILPYVDYNSAITYAFLLLIINVLSFFFFILYCKKHFEITNFKINISKDLKEIFAFSSWDLFGNFSVTVRTEGVSILQNLFFGVGINAAIGIATQVQGAISSFASNILFASKPQVIKSYAQENYAYMNNLIVKSAKYSLLFLCFIIVPLTVKLDYVVYLWLGKIPEYVLPLIKWFLLFVLGANISSCVMMGIHATGRIKMSSIINGSLYLLVLPLSYFLLQYYKNPAIPYMINFFFVLIGANLNMLYLRKYVPSFSIKELYTKAILPTVLLSAFTYLFLKYFVTFFANNFLSFLIVLVASVLIMLVVSWMFILERDVKKLIVNRLRR